MFNGRFETDRTALLFVDPYNDFLSAGGKLWPMVEPVAEQVGLIDNLKAITTASRAAGIQVFVVPHRRWEPGNYESWRHPSPYQVASGEMQMFAKGSWGGEWRPEFAPQPGDIVVQEHLGEQRLCEHGLGFSAEAEGDHESHRNWTVGEHVYRGDQPIRGGTRVSCHADQGCDRGLQHGPDACRA
jgi:hypothetical protein